MSRAAMHLSAALAVPAALATFLFADVAHAATTCHVDFVDNDVTMPNTLLYCVDQVNQGLADHVDIRTFQWYAPNVPLVFERSARVTGYGRIVMPGDSFVGDSLFEIGTSCIGAGCPEQVHLEIEGLEISAQGTAGIRGIRVNTFDTLTLESVALHGFSDVVSGACLSAEDRASVSINNSELYECSAQQGGAIYSRAELFTVSGSSLHHNMAADGGAIYVGSGVGFERELDVVSSVLQGNEAELGGAIYSWHAGSFVHVADSTLENNTASVHGGGLYAEAAVERSRLLANDGGLLGGGMVLLRTSTVLDTEVAENSALHGGGIVVVGGLGSVIDGSTLSGNRATGSDGIVGGGLLVDGADLEVINSTVSKNSTDDAGGDGRGGGIAAVNGAEIQLRHTTLADNEADYGGGVHVDALSKLDFQSSIVANSQAQDCELIGSSTSVTSLDTDGSCSVDVSTDPGLGMLNDNGGSTLTHWPGSVIERVGKCFVAVDQRDEPRPTDRCTIGSVEP